MNKTLLSLTLAAPALFVLPAIGHAQVIDGAFLNANLGSASLYREPFDDNELSYGANIGYRWAVSPDALIGFEAGYADIGKYTDSAHVSILQPLGTPWTEPQIYTASGSTEMSGWMIGANGRVNLSPNWYIGGRAGFLRASIDTRIHVVRPDGSVFQQNHGYTFDGWYAGTGFGYDISNNLSLGLNYDYYRAGDIGFRIYSNVVSVIGEYRF